MTLGREQLAALAAHLRAAGSPFAEIRGAVLLKGGQSNPTYKLATAAGPVVLRMRPIGAGAWAHDVAREFRVLSALQGTAVPVPRVHLLCPDDSVLGGAFYLMDFIDGRIIDDCTLPGLTPAERGAIYRSFAEAFAALHDVDYQSVGLADFGKPDFVARQLKLHTAKFREYQAVLGLAPNSDFEWLADHLAARVPAQRATAVIHNDIRIGNVVLHPSAPKVIAILDWEMSTLGDPFADAALLALPYHFPVGNPQGTFAGVDTGALGLPSARELLGWYCAARGVPSFEEEVFMTAFNLLRYASVYAGIAARHRQGIAVSPDAAAYGPMVAPTLARARIVAESLRQGQLS